jgi:hypothetical protein
MTLRYLVVVGLLAASAGRLTGNARHLVDPANKVFFATMEDGLYEVDVRSLAVTDSSRRSRTGPSRDRRRR